MSLGTDRTVTEARLLSAALAKAKAERDDLLGWLEAISDEARDFDDHDGRMGHVSWATLQLARGAMAKVKR